MTSTISKLQITVFPKAIPLPANVDEKKEEARKCLYGKILEVDDENDLFAAVTSHAWSPYIFENNHRLIKNFLYADFLALDIDSGLTIGEAEKRCQRLNLMALIAPSVSHKPDHHKFRIIFPLCSRITDLDVFEATWEYMLTKFPELDSHCSDLARFFFGCNPDTDCAILIEGDLLLPRKAKKKEHLQQSSSRTEYVSTNEFENKDLLHALYGSLPDKIPLAVDYFFREAHTGIEGGWIWSLNAAVFALAYHGIDEQKIFAAIEMVSPDELDSRDVATIQRALRDGHKKHLEDNNGDDL